VGLLPDCRPGGASANSIWQTPVTYTDRIGVNARNGKGENDDRRWIGLYRWHHSRSLHCMTTRDAGAGIVDADADDAGKFRGRLRP